MDKALVAYATWTGATRSVAEEIANVLNENGFDSDVMPVKKVKSIEKYDLILLGTSVHATKTVGGFRKFLKHFYKELTEKPIAFYVVCANMMEDCKENQMETIGWLENTTRKFENLHPLSIGLFAGAAITDSEEYNRLNFLIRKIIDSMKEKMITDHGTSDFRDWTKIREWAQEVIQLYGD